MRRYLVWTAWLPLVPALATGAAAPQPAQRGPQPAPAAPAAPSSTPASRAEVVLTTAAGPGGRIRVEGPGGPVASFTPRTPPARRGTPRARQVIAAGRRVLEVRLQVVGGKLAQQEVWLGDLGATAEPPPARAAALWSGLVGAQDADGETARDVAVESDGVRLFETASRLTRCDGIPARVFVQSWDFARRRWTARGPALPAAGNAPLVQARRGAAGMPGGRPRGGFFWNGASTGTAARDVRSLAVPDGLDDGDPNTVWHAGAGDPTGAFLTARSASAGVSVTGLRLLPGDTSDPRAFREAARPRRLVVLLGRAPEQRFEVELVEDEDGGVARFRQPFWIPLPRPVVTSCVTVMIRETTAGTRPLAIGDLEVFTEVDGAGAVDRVLAGMTAGGGAGCEARVPLLVGLGPAAVAPTAAALRGSTVPRGARECLLEALDRLTAGAGAAGSAAPAAVPEPQAEAVAAAFAAGLAGASAAEEKRVLGALPRLGRAAVAPLGRLLADQRRPEADRVRAARALAGLQREDANGALLAQVGREPPALRVALRELLASARPPVVDAIPQALAATPADATARRADLLFVLGAAAAPADPQTRAAALRLLEDATEPTAPFEVRARAVGALGRLGDDGAAGALVRLRASSTEPVLRRLAVRELADAPSAQALPALRSALADPDPQVREAAALALGQRGDREAGASLLAATRRERWPFVRRAQVTALGRLCAAGSSAVLLRAAQRDTLDVRRAAFAGLVRCRDPRAGALLTATLDRRAEHPELRAHAARLLGELGDREAAPALAEAVKRLRVESQADLALETSTVVAMQTLTDFGGKEAVGAALALVNDERPVLRRAGIEALGRLCDRSAAAALAAAARDTDLSVSRAAAAAQRRCQQNP